MSSNFFWATASVALFLSATVGNIAKEAIKARVIDVKITWVSNCRCPITQIGHLKLDTHVIARRLRDK